MQDEPKSNNLQFSIYKPMEDKQKKQPDLAEPELEAAPELPELELPHEAEEKKLPSGEHEALSQ